MFAVMVQPMSPSDQWLFETLNSMRQETSEQHQRLRSDVNAGFDRLREEMRQDRQHVAAVRDDVTAIKAQRISESESSRREADAAKRTAGWVALFVSGAIGVLSLLTDWFWKK